MTPTTFVTACFLVVVLAPAVNAVKIPVDRNDVTDGDRSFRGDWTVDVQSFKEMAKERCATFPLSTTADSTSIASSTGPYGSGAPPLTTTTEISNMATVGNR